MNDMDMNMDMEKLAEIGRKAMNIRIIESSFCSVNSDNEPIEGTEIVKAIVYNLESISTEEVEEELENGKFEFDPRILVTDLERIRYLFPHAGEENQ